jgi:hypothetical protein
MMRHLGIVTATAAIALAMPGNAKSLYDIAPQMRQDAQCMYASLMNVSGIDQVKLGDEDRRGWAYPYLEFRAAPDKNGDRQIVRYVANPACTLQADDDREDFHCEPHGGAYTFVADLSRANAKETRAVEKRWKRDCGVIARSFFLQFVGQSGN